MEMLLFKPNAVQIVHKCLQDFYGTAAANEVFESLFGGKSPAVKEAADDYNRISRLSDKSDDHDKRAFNSHIRNLKKDFLSAHTLQSFVSQNGKLHHTLLQHRVELYVRIKNSFHGLEPTASNAESECNGASIECPIRSARDAEKLSSELLDQFLHFADWYLDDHNWCVRSEVDAIMYVLDAMEMLQTVYGTKATDADEPPSVDMNRMGSVPKSRNEPVTVGSPVDEGPSAESMDLHKVVRDKLEKYEQRAEQRTKDEQHKKLQQQSKEGKFRWPLFKSSPHSPSQCPSPC